MTFPETLRELARLRPEVFKVKEILTGLETIQLRENEQLKNAWLVDSPTSFDQDDIDSIMAELDRRVLLYRKSAVQWTGLTASVYSGDWTPQFEVETYETEKNPAMQKALTAVVEEIKKGEKG